MKTMLYSAIMMFAVFFINACMHANEMLDKTSQIEPSSAPAVTGDSLESESNIDLKEFIFRIEAYLAVNPGDHNKGWIIRASAYLKMGDPNPMNAIIAYSNGVEASANRKYAEALQYYEEAARLDPGFPWSANNLAWVLSTCPEEQLRDGQRAIEYSRQAIKVPKTEVPDFLNTLAASHAAAGDYNSAVRLCRKSVEMWPRNQFKEMLNCFIGKNVYIDQKLPPEDEDLVSAEGCGQAKWGMCKLDVMELFTETDMKSNDLVVANSETDKSYKATMMLHFKYDMLWKVRVIASAIRIDDIEKDFITEALKDKKKTTMAKNTPEGILMSETWDSDETQILLLYSPLKREAVIDFVSKKYQYFEDVNASVKQKS